jgi:1,4-alpha-glucan branching enzyme
MSEQTVAGMGAIPFAGGVAFRVWAPHADKVAVIGDFNDWNEKAAPSMTSEGNGNWYAELADAKVGDEYKYLITNGGNTFQRIDPYARAVTNSVGNGIVYDHGAFDWQGDDFQLPPHHELVIYELHVGSFYTEDEDSPGTFKLVADKLDHLLKLGVNAIQIMPVMEFAGDYSWGYNPAHIFAVESAYGGPDALKTLVREAHSNGLAVILDVVYNHFGPSDLDLWQFDGWTENDKGGIYFYNDDRSSTPWGDTRPDYGREEVRRFIHDDRRGHAPRPQDQPGRQPWCGLPRPVGRGLRPPGPRGGDRPRRRLALTGRARRRDHQEVQRRRLPAGHLHRVA